MNPNLVRLLRVLPLFALGGWASALVVMVPDDSWTLATAWRNPAAIHAAVAGGLSGLIISPLLVFRKARWWAGLPLGLLAGALGIWLFFFMWPHDWQAGRWNAHKSTGLFLAVYWTSLLPLAMAIGVAATAWSQRPVRPPKWARLEPEGSASSAHEARVDVFHTDDDTP